MAVLNILHKAKPFIESKSIAYIRWEIGRGRSWWWRYACRLGMYRLSQPCDLFLEKALSQIAATFFWHGAASNQRPAEAGLVHLEIKEN